MTDSFVPHRFNPAIAKLYSIPAALIFQFISFSCERQKAKFIPLTLDDLCKHYPYLTRITVWRGLQKLLHPGKRTPQLVIRKKIDDVFLYGPVAPDEKFALYAFDVRVAVEHGVVPAIILHSIGHWVKQNWKRKAEAAFGLLNREDYANDFQAMWSDAFVSTANAAAHTTTIKEWLVRHAYLSHRTAVRGFSCLQQAGLLTYRRGKRSKPIWSLCLDMRAEYANKLLSLSEIENVDANLKCLDANLKCLDAKMKRDLPVSPEGSEGCRALDEGLIDEGIISQHDDGFASPLAGAQGVARSASNMATASPAVQAKLHRLNQPGYRRVRKTRKPERQYVRHPKPGDEDFDLYFDDLTPDQRREYLARVG